MGADFNYQSYHFLQAICGGYCTSNAMTTFDRPTIPGILEVRSGVPLHKI